MSGPILHVLEAFAGGTERHLLDLVRHVREFDHVVAVPSMHLGESTAAAADCAREAGARVEWIEMRRSASLGRNLTALLALRNLIGRLDPCIIHGHSAIGGGFARLAAIGSGRPVVYTPNGIDRRAWALQIERLLRRGTQRFIAVSAGEAEYALRQRLTEPDRLGMIPNGIEPESPAPLAPTLRARLGIPADAPLVGSLGRLTWQKAPEVYVSACAIVAAQVPGAHFVLIGKGPKEPTVRRRIAATGIGDRFHRVPRLARAASGLAELDVYVLASRFEGGPYTVLEAMRAGVPVVATAADGTRDTVVDGVTGIVVPIEDASALAAATVRLLRDPAQRQTLGSAARARVSERFDVKRMAAETAGLYRELVSAADLREPDRSGAAVPERVGR